MPDPGSLVYQGREGTGAATIYNPDRNVARIVAQQNANRKNAIAQQKNDLAAQDRRQKQLNEMIESNYGKPGWFQQEDSVNEIEGIKKNSIEHSYQNPQSSISELAYKFSNDKAETNRRIAKRNELQKTIELNNAAIKEDELLDGDWVSAYQTKLISEKKDDGTYGNRNVDQIDKGRLQTATSHPRAYNYAKGVTDVVSDVKNQMIQSSDGPVTPGKYGFEYDDVQKKYRFKVDSKGQISDDLVKYVLESNDRVGDRIRWDIAKEEIVGSKNEKYLTPEEIDAIDKKYEDIQFKNDPSIVLKERAKVRESLNQLQQTESRHDLSFTKYSEGDGYGENNPVDVRLERINNIRNVFNDGITPNKTGVDAIAGLAGGKFGTYSIMSAEPVLYNESNKKEINPTQYKKDVDRIFKDNIALRDAVAASAPDNFDKVGSKKTLKLQVRTATTEGTPTTETLYIDLSKPESVELINSIYESIPGNEKVSNEKLYIQQKKKKGTGSGVNFKGGEKPKSGVVWK